MVAAAITAGLGLVQTVSSFIEKQNAKKEMNALQSQRKAYQTPEEIFKIVRAAQNNASSGYDASTFDYLTSQIDRGFGSSLGTLNRLGGDANDAASLFEARMNEVMKVGANSHAENMRNFSTYLNSLETLSSNKAAEQVSADNILKDRIQAVAGTINESNKSMFNGLNSIIGGVSSIESEKLFNKSGGGDKTNTRLSINTTPSSSNFTPRQWDELKSILSYKGSPDWAAKAAM